LTIQGPLLRSAPGNELVIDFGHDIMTKSIVASFKIR